MKAFIFDMDGTLVDNMGYHELAWQSLLSDMGKEMSIEELRHVAYGKNEEVLERVFLKKHTDEELEKLFKIKEVKYRTLYTPHLKLIAGLLPFLTKAKAMGIPMAIGTGAGIRNLNFVLDGTEIRHFFEGIVVADDVRYGKPHPETFLKAAQLLGVSPANCIVFEDVQSGLEAAHRAGMQSVALTTTYSKAFLSGFPSVIEVVSDYESISPNEILEKSQRNS